MLRTLPSESLACADDAQIFHANVLHDNGADAAQASDARANAIDICGDAGRREIHGGHGAFRP